MSPSDRREIRTIIKFCHDLRKTPTQTLKMIESTNRKYSVSRALVFKWHRRFSDGQDRLEEHEGCGRKKQYCETIVTSIRDALDSDRRLMIRELAGRFDMGCGPIHRILTVKLKMSKVHTRWVPRLLKDHKKERSVRDSRAFASRLVAQYDQQWFEGIFQQWVHRHRRCIECEGHYFEKK